MTNLKKPFVGTIPLGPCRTRDGREARVICNDRKGTDYSVIALIQDDEDDEVPSTFTESGLYFKYVTSAEDLFPLPERRETFENVYLDSDGTAYTGIAEMSRSDAMTAMADNAYTAENWIGRIKLVTEDGKLVSVSLDADLETTSGHRTQGAS